MAKNWFTLIKRLFISDKQSKRRRWAFRLLKVKEIAPLSAPPLTSTQQSVSDVPEVIKVQKLNQDSAATKIQAIFRGYLARKALAALKGVVKLQALIRGWAVRQQTINTLKCLQSLVNIQAQALHCQDHKSHGDKDIKVDLNSQKRWNDSTLTKEEIKALFLTKREASIKRERSKRYYLNHRRSAETERDKAYGRRRYWLEQWVDMQLAKSVKNQAESPTHTSKKTYQHKKQRSIGDEHSFIGSPSTPAYMAYTESAKARSRSLSSPRLRPLSFDVCSEITSPYKHKLSPLSSVNSELTGSSWIGNHLNYSPRLRGPVKSTMSTKEVRLRGIYHQDE